VIGPKKFPNKRDALQAKNAQWKRLANTSTFINLEKRFQGGRIVGKIYARNRKSCMVM
jgi:hypothetical protein